MFTHNLSSGENDMQTQAGSYLGESYSLCK